MYEGPQGQVGKGYAPTLLIAAGIAVIVIAVWLLVSKAFA